ncbi:45489_t:CDS:2 [Gigaspora margarita]|uniref:45489_t:CDS:1 n=1 Tax=Gigaspora margarita TaxID=4874 RepID=A0ABN7UWC5_GIGMA|nr:45489_t:CDS:2 [Gigaspora margarita]
MVISAELFQVINNWNLSNKTFAITTNSGANMIKSIQLLSEHLSEVKQQPCIFSFAKTSSKASRSPKNSNQLLDDYDNYNPLDIITDVKTRWNSVYYAWKRIIELHNSMLHVSTILLTKPDRISQQEGEKLHRLYLSYNEKHLVYPYVKLLKKAFASKHEKGESYDTYFNLVYGQQCEDRNEEESESSASNNDAIPSGDDFNQTELLPATDITNELWSTPLDLVQIVAILDPQFKDFKWDDTFEERKNMNMQQQTTFYDCSDNDDFFEALENKMGGSASVARRMKFYVI